MAPNTTPSGERRRTTAAPAARPQATAPSSGPAGGAGGSGVGEGQRGLLQPLRRREVAAHRVQVVQRLPQEVVVGALGRGPPGGRKGRGGGEGGGRHDTPPNDVWGCPGWCGHSARAGGGRRRHPPGRRARWGQKRYTRVVHFWEKRQYTRSQKSSDPGRGKNLRTPNFPASFVWRLKPGTRFA